MTKLHHCWLTSVPLAHRAKHNPSHPDNSLQAITEAIKHHKGVEADIRLLGDHTPVLAHDAHTETQQHAKPICLKTLTQSSLRGYTHPQTHQPLPTLAQVFNQIDGRVPILLDLKPIAWPTSKKLQPLIDQLLAYKGPVAVQSFDRRVLQLLDTMAQQHRTSLVLGQLLPHCQKMPWLARLFCKPFPLRFEKAQFVNAPKNLIALPYLQKQAKQLPLLTWTVTHPDEWQTLKPYCHNAVYEGLTTVA
jgi:glycerophosphoryl diester phosphodiesterase